MEITGKKTELGIGKEVFDTIFMENFQRVRNFIYYKSGDIETAEDIAQDAFLKVWEMRDKINRITVKQLLYTIANNIFINTMKQKQLAYKFSNQILNDRYIESPEFLMEVKEFDDRLQKTIAGLQEKSRVVFLMNRIDQMTYGEIAVNLGISVKAVEKRMKKALEYLRQRIEQKF